jgi:hypothetical protein
MDHKDLERVTCAGVFTKSHLQAVTSRLGRGPKDPATVIMTRRNIEEPWGLAIPRL